MYSPFADPEAGPPGLPHGSANGDDPGHHPRSPTAASAPTPHASSFPTPPQAPAKHDEVTNAMIKHMQQQLAELLLAHQMTSATPAPLPHPTTPTPTWSTPGVPKTDIPPLPSAAIKALMEAATLTPINVMSFYLSLFAQIRSLGAELAPGLLLPPSSPWTCCANNTLGEGVCEVC